MKEDRIGGLWRSTSQNDKAPFAKGEIEVGGQKIRIVVWTNRWKQQGETTPDLYIERDAPRQGEPAF